MESQPTPLQVAPEKIVELSLRSIEVSYGDSSILHKVSLDIFRGETIVVIGPSGGGKSTLLRCINLMQPLKHGEIHYREQRIVHGARRETDVNSFRQHVGFVFQGFNLWPNKTILGNLTEAPRFVLKMKRKEAELLAVEWLERVGLQSELLLRYPSELSGGQQQRVALARALMMNPSVLLLDEITSALDVETTFQMLKLLESLRNGERTFILVSHHLRFAERVANRVAVLIGGRIVELGPATQVIHSPQHEQSKHFLSIVMEL